MTDKELKSWRAWQLQLKPAHLHALHRACRNALPVVAVVGPLAYALVMGEGLTAEQARERETRMQTQAETVMGFDDATLWWAWWRMTDHQTRCLELAAELEQEIDARELRSMAGRN